MMISLMIWNRTNNEEPKENWLAPQKTPASFSFINIEVSDVISGKMWYNDCEAVIIPAPVRVEQSETNTAANRYKE